jgi:hypothetical protein
MATKAAQPGRREAGRRHDTVGSYTRKVRWDTLFRDAIERDDIEEAIRLAVEQIVEARHRKKAAAA